MRSLAFIFLIFTGCTGYQFVAPAHCVPVNHEKGHCVGNLSLNTCQLDYAFSEHFSAFVTTSFRLYEDRENRTWHWADSLGFIKMDKHNELGLGVTCFKNYGDFGSFELLTGIGYGTVKYDNFQKQQDVYEFSFHARKFNCNIQPSLSVRYEDFIDFSIYSRISYNQYFNIRSSMDLRPFWELKDYDAFFYGRQSAGFCFLEPGFQIRIGLKYIKLLLEVSGTVDLFSNEIIYKPYRFMVGISYDANILQKN
jgi:hypothetical protein